MPFDGIDLLDITFHFQRLTGIKIPFAARKAWRPETIADIANHFTAHAPLAPEPPICPTIQNFHSLRNQIASPLLQSDLRPDTPLTSILGKKYTHKRWQTLGNCLNIQLPEHVDYSGAMLLWLFLATFQTALIPLFFDRYLSMGQGMLLGLLSSFVETFAILALLHPLLPRRPAARFQTLADLLAFTTLNLDQPNSLRNRPMAKSEIRLLTRHLVSQTTGLSIRALPLRKKLATLPSHV